MNWVAIAAAAAQAIADAQALVAIGAQLAPEVETAIMLLTQKTTLTPEQRASDLANLNAMQAELNSDAQEME